MKRDTASRWERETKDVQEQRSRITQQFLPLQPQKGTSRYRDTINAARAGNDRAVFR